MFTPHNMSHVTCNVSHITCHVSHVTCHMSRVTCHMSHVIIIFLQSGEAYRWCVCYQRALPCLVFTTLLITMIKFYPWLKGIYHVVALLLAHVVGFNIWPSIVNLNTLHVTSENMLLSVDYLRFYMHEVKTLPWSYIQWISMLASSPWPTLCIMYYVLCIT